LITGIVVLGLCLLAASSTPAVASDDEAAFDYFYIVANEDGSSGGHAAIRFGDDVYHFQSENGLLVLHRDRVEEFLYSYTLLGNRTVESTTVAVSLDTYARLVDAFRHRHRAGEAQLRKAAMLEQDRKLLEYLSKYGSDPGREPTPGIGSVRGLGYFDVSRAQGTDRSAVIDRLRRRIVETHGAGLIAARRTRYLLGLKELLAEDPTSQPIDTPASVYDFPPFSRSYYERWADLRAGLAALDVLENAPALDRQSYHRPDGEAFALDATERKKLARYAGTLELELVDLLASKREDWGQTFLIGLARLVCLDESIRSGRLVFLDTYPEAPDRLSYAVVDGNHELAPLMIAENKKQLDASRAYFREAEDPGELAWERVEERSNRYREIRESSRANGKVRVARGHLVPSRTAPYPTTSVTALEPALTSRRLHEADERLRRYRKALRRLHGYHLVENNCVTAIFETLNAVFSDSPTLVRNALGGYVADRGSLTFVPFVSARRVDAYYRVVGRTTYASYRAKRLAAMRNDEPRGRVALRESNTFTADSYRGSAKDSFFVFFTDDTPALRPLFGVFNLAAAAGQTAWGIVTAPIDRGRNLRLGLRGAFVTLPELAFSNIRKGSNEWIPDEHREIVAQ